MNIFYVQLYNNSKMRYTTTILILKRKGIPDELIHVILKYIFTEERFVCINYKFGIFSRVRLESPNVTYELVMKNYSDTVTFRVSKLDEDEVYEYDYCVSEPYQNKTIEMFLDEISDNHDIIVREYVKLDILKKKLEELCPF